MAIKMDEVDEDCEEIESDMFQPIKSCQREAIQDCEQDGSLTQSESFKLKMHSDCNKGFSQIDECKNCANFFKCNECDKSFSTNEKLNWHMKIKHTTDNLYKCDFDECHYKSGNLAHLVRHKMAKHSDGEKPYKYKSANFFKCNKSTFYYALH